MKKKQIGSRDRTSIVNDTTGYLGRSAADESPTVYSFPEGENVETGDNI
jgi:hypothetical protein